MDYEKEKDRLFGVKAGFFLFLKRFSGDEFSAKNENDLVCVWKLALDSDSLPWDKCEDATIGASVACGDGQGGYDGRDATHRMVWWQKVWQR